MEKIIESFDPIIDSQSRVLILGSMPGPESLRKNQYYGNERNQFWTIIYGIFNRETELSYEKRIAFLLKKRIALWDTLESCQRVGASDSRIKDEMPNDFRSIFSKYRNVKYVFFNGAKAEKSFEKHIGFEMLQIKLFKRLPSTSPTPGKNVKSFPEKIKEWEIIKDCLTGIR